MWTCDCPKELKMSNNGKGASGTVKVLAAESCRKTMWRDFMVERSRIDHRHQVSWPITRVGPAFTMK